MKRRGVFSVLFIALLVASVQPAAAWHGHGRVFIGVGPWWGGPFFPYPPPYAYPYPYPYPYPPYPYYPPPLAVEPQPQIYVQQPPAQPVPLAVPQAPPAYWYYCASAKAYYPTAQSCREAWIKVPPPPQ